MESLPTVRGWYQGRLLAMLAEDKLDNEELQVLHMKHFLPTDAGACVLLRVLDALSGKRAVVRCFTCRRSGLACAMLCWTASWRC